MTLSDKDAWILRRAIAKQPLQDVEPDNPLLSLLFKMYDITTDEGYSRISQFVTFDTDVMTHVMKMDPTQAAPKPETPDAIDGDLVYVPELPAAAQLSAEAYAMSESVGHWYRQTAQWAQNQSPMTPPHFLQLATIWTIGLAVARRIRINLHESIYPHLYALIVAETSRYAKSTGMNIFYHLVLKAMPHMLIPGSATTEAMIEMLSGGLPANYENLPERQQKLIREGKKYAGQRGIMLDEFSSLLGSSKKDYMQGFPELIMRLYDAREKEQHYTRSGGLITIEQPGISIFGATTPAAMARALSNESWENGEIARYFIMFREDVLTYDDSYGDRTIPEQIIAPLRRLHSSLPIPEDEFGHVGVVKAKDATITADAFHAYKAYAKAVRFDMIEDAGIKLVGNYTRLHVQAMKMALALAAMDCLTTKPNDLVKINLGHWALAQQLTECSRHHLHHLLIELNQSSDNRNQRAVLGLIKQHKGGLTVRDLCRSTGRRANDIRSALDVLLESGDLEEVEHKPARGRPTKFYRLPE